MIGRFKWFIEKRRPRRDADGREKESRSPLLEARLKGRK